MPANAPDAKTLTAALKKIRGDSALSANFANDPAGTLKSVGIDPKSVKVGPMAAVGSKPVPLNMSEIRRINPTTGKPGTAITICGSVGGGAGISVCGSVG